MNQIATDKFISEGNVRVNGTDKKSAEYKALKGNIKKVGILTPISYRKNDKGEFVVINGHQRLSIAKDLKLTKIPAFESNGEVDDLTKQLSTNMFTVGMSHLDASFAIQQMIDKGIINTRKQLSAMFGKSVAWVDTALAFCNLHPWIKTFFKEHGMSKAESLPTFLTEISKSPINFQENELTEMVHNYMHMDEDESITDENVAEVINEYDCYGDEDNQEEFFARLSARLKTNESEWKFICDVIGEKTFREYEKKHDVKYTYQNALFEEFADAQYCQDWEFLADVFFNETEIGQFLKDNKVTDDSSYGDWHVSFSFENKVSTLKSKVKKHTDHALKDVIIVGWNGNIFQPELYCNKPEENEVVDEVIIKDDYDAEPKDPHALKYNKFNKWAAPIINEYIQKNVIPIQTDKKGNLIVLDWLINDREQELVINKPYRYEGIDDHPFHPLLDAKMESDHQLITAMTSYWFKEHYMKSSYKGLDVLFQKLGLKSCIEIVSDEFNANNEETRKGYFKILSKDELAIITANNMLKTKAEYVDKAASIDWSDIPYIDLVCTDKGSGSNSLKTYSS